MTNEELSRIATRKTFDCENCEDSKNCKLGSGTHSSQVYGCHADDWEDGYLQALEDFENNRLAHCDSMTEDEYNRESEFVDNFIKEHQRTPTFSDAIEFARKQMIDRACEWLQGKLADRTIYRLRNAMKE